MTQNFFSTTTAYNGQAVADLETQLNDQYRAEVGDVIFERSVEFGKAVATRIFEWSKKDNAAWPTSVTPPTGDGVWKSETGAAPVQPVLGP